MLTLSICVVAYNEEKFLLDLLRDIKNQKYPHKHTEVVLVDSMSTDNTLEIMQKFKNENTEFYSVQVLKNPKKVQAAGWNVAITHAGGDVIARIDAHTMLTPEYSWRVMKNIAEGEDVVGGIRPCIIKNNTPWGNVLLLTENSLFGSSVNASRHSQKKAYVKTMFHAAYRREVFERAGLFNENLLRTEDNEMHFRIRQAGYRLCYDPKIISYQYARNSLKGMLKQKFGNGYWIGLTLGICPGCISLYHLIPGVFTVGIILTTILAFLGVWELSALMWFLYAAFALANTLIAVKRSGIYPQTVLMPFLFLILHVSYGVGTIIGIFRITALRISEMWGGR